MQNPIHRKPNSQPNNHFDKLLSDDFIRRSPVERSAGLGSFYDARTDSIVGNISLPNNFITKLTTYNPVYCKVLKDNLIEGENLLDEIGIDDDLWLSLVLNMVSADGIPSLVNSSFNINTKTRILHYCFVSDEKCITDQVYKVKDNILAATVDKEITHMVAAIRLGIHLVIILQLSTDYKYEIDDLLEKISQSLTKNIFKITKNEKQLFNRLIITKVFSNIKDLSEISTLFELFKKVVEIKLLTHVHCPLQCFLRPIQSFCPSYVKSKAKYVPFDQDNIMVVKKCLLPLWFKMKQLNTLVNSEIENLFRQHLKREFREIQQDIKKVQEEHSVQMQRIHDLIVKFRSGKLKQELITDILINTVELSLENNIDICLKRLRPLKEKEKFINDFNQKNIKYFNMQNLSIEQNDDLNTILQKTIKTDKAELIFCSTDQLRDENPSQWNHKYNNWMQKREAIPVIDLIYADFSYHTSFHLSKIQILLINSSTDIEKQFDLSNLSKSSTIDTVQSPNQQSKQTEERLSSLKSANLLDTEIKSLQEKTLSIASEVLLEPNEEYKEIPAISHESISSKEPVTKNTSPRTEPSNNVEEVVTLSTSPSQPVIEPHPRKNSRSTDIKSSSNSKESLNPSTEENKDLLTELSTYMEEQCNISNTLTISTSQATSPTKTESTSVEELLNSQAVSTSLPTTICASTLEKQSDTTDHDASVPASPNSISESRQRRRNKCKNTTEPSDQMKCQELPRTECTPSSPEKQLNLVQEQSQTENTPTRSTSDNTPRKRHRPDSSCLRTKKHINVLLLGESGVGKSTFINALVNYITFESFEMARCRKPVVVMPVSFMMTVGDDFKEKIVRFGDEDSNEDYYHPGQSVTQHCRSYVFQIGTKTKIRFIDTPGMGDTRGLDQDDLNMQHILSFISNLSHLNAICILLKPNESRLNIVLRSYFDRLLNFLGETARHNIIFCFTNTRATFFAPGNTGPLLKSMLSSSAIKDIPFKKSNTFCFDSESFRYLVAKRDGVEFDKYQEDEYQQSWASSVTESDRLLQYLCEATLKPYPQNEWRSVEHAQFRINQMTRPMLETTRNFFRNILVLQRNRTSRLIKLCPIVLHHSSTICYKCDRTRKRYSDFWILQDDLHIDSDQCKDCDCPRQNHVEIDYRLEYELSDEMGTESFPYMKSTVEQLQTTMIEFAKFYAKNRSLSNQTDPILSTLKGMVAEEKEHRSKNDPTCLNPFLYDILVNFRKEYKQAQKTSMLTDASINLSSIYDLIEKISKIDEIEKQMSLIKQKQKSFIEKYEKELL
ncbi:unnamed protein product [Rotaria sp. Silwood2]|nr:unnamed protein product [Rotaria sp. Silwood2]